MYEDIFYVSVYICMYVYIHTYIGPRDIWPSPTANSNSPVCMNVYVHVCMCVHTYVCMYVCIHRATGHMALSYCELQTLVTVVDSPSFTELYASREAIHRRPDLCVLF